MADGELVKQCPKIHVFKGDCTLPAGHDGPHAWENANAEVPAWKQGLKPTDKAE